MAQSAARWLFRSHGWLRCQFQHQPTSLAASGCSALRWTDAEPGWTQPACDRCSGAPTAWGPFTTTFGVPSAASARGYATEAGAVAAEPSNASSGGLSMPSWLRNLFPGAKKTPAGSAVAGAAASASGSGAGKADSKDSADAEDLKVLEELRNMSMEGYVEYCKKMRSGSTPPRPRLPPLRFNRAEFRGWVDEARVSFLRMQQHERIGSLITKEESDLILAKREDVLYDRALMEAIAGRTGMYIDLEVKDCIEQFLELRKKTERMHRFVTEFGHPLPKTVKEQQYALKFMERQEEEEQLQAALARRDTAGCPLRLKLPWAGGSALCELTGRPYWQCCGRLTAGAQSSSEAQPKLQLPPHMQQQQQNEPSPDPERVRVAYRRFKGHIGRKFRKAYIEASKPRIRRGVGHATAFFWKPNE